jgi:preprotein translocase subunit SecA
VAPVAAPSGLAEFAAAAAAQAQDGGVATKERQQPAPSALRTKGIDDNAPQLTYTGPSEDGSAQVQRQSGNGDNGGPRHAAKSRRERREAARRQAKAGKKG